MGTPESEPAPREAPASRSPAGGYPATVGRPRRVGLLGLPPLLAAAVWEALVEVGYEAVVVPLDRLAVETVAQAGVDVLVLDAHDYVNDERLLAAVRSHRATAALPVIVLGSARPPGVPAPPAVVKLGPRFDADAVLHALLDVVPRTA